jgi:hypothetical protein
VHDTGLVAVPSRFRRLGGLVRHLQGTGEPWPAKVTLVADDAGLSVLDADGASLGTWAVAEVHVRRVASGPPVSFVVDVPGASHLLAAAAGGAVDALLAHLGS